jgi:hypothetical protein
MVHEKIATWATTDGMHNGLVTSYSFRKNPVVFIVQKKDDEAKRAVRRYFDPSVTHFMNQKTKSHSISKEKQRSSGSARHAHNQCDLNISGSQNKANVADDNNLKTSCNGAHVDSTKSILRKRKASNTVGKFPNNTELSESKRVKQSTAAEPIKMI